MTPGEIERNLEAAKKLAEQSQGDINKFINVMNEHALKLVTEIYADDLLTLESNGFIELIDVLYRQLTKLAIDVDNIVFNNQV